MTKTPRRGLLRFARPLVVVPLSVLLVVLAAAVLLLWPSSPRSALAPSHASVPAGGGVAVPDTGGGPGLR